MLAPMDLQSPSTSLTVFCIGVALHVFVFRIGEWDLATTKLLRVFATTSVAFVILVKVILLSPPDNTLWTALTIVSWLVTSLITGIGISMLVYRVLFHRLGRFPGPFGARLSSLYGTLLSAKNLHLYEEVEKLHNTYGDFVRLGGSLTSMAQQLSFITPIGPSELSINNPKAVHAISSSQSPCTKGPFYTVLDPRKSMHMIRDPAEHARRRKVWDHAFSAKSLRDYEPRVSLYTDQLLAHLEKTKGQPVNVSDWFNFYSFDVMGDLAFGKSFNMLQNGVKHYFMASLHADMTTVGVLSRLPWLFPIFKATPGLNYEHLRFWKWVDDQIDERKKTTADKPDVFKWLLKDYNAQEKPTFNDEMYLAGDAYLVAVAGSDTTAAGLTTIFFQLALDHRVLKTLQNEIDRYFETAGTVDYTSLSKLPYLDAVITETMRLHPPIPSGVQRMTPPDRLLIDNTWIPGNTIVQVPYHTLFRDERLFLQPQDFIPERWTTRPELVRDSSSFVPFSNGRYACIGKHLGLMELRLVVSQIVRRYDVEFAPGQTAEAFLKGKRDAFTLSLGKLEMVMNPRR